MALGTHCGDEIDGPIDIGDAEGMGACWYDYDEDGVRSPLLYTTAAQIPKERYPAAPDDPVRYGFVHQRALAGASASAAIVAADIVEQARRQPTPRACDGQRARSLAERSLVQTQASVATCGGLKRAERDGAQACSGGATAAAARTATYEQMRKLLNIEMRRSAVRTIRRTGNWTGAVSR